MNDIVRRVAPPPFVIERMADEKLAQLLSEREQYEREERKHKRLAKKAREEADRKRWIAREIARLDNPDQRARVACIKRVILDMGGFLDEQSVNDRLAFQDSYYTDMGLTPPDAEACHTFNCCYSKQERERKSESATLMYRMGLKTASQCMFDRDL